MKNSAAWQLDFEKEVDRAQKAREEGNEGMARVCSRRAAGVVVRAYYAFRGKTLKGASVLNHLRAIYESDNEPEDVKSVCRHFTLRITPDHLLPEDIDLIEDVIWLKATLFPES